MNKPFAWALGVLLFGFAATADARSPNPALDAYEDGVAQHNLANKLFDEKNYKEGNAARAQGIAAYERAVAIDPGLFQAWVNLGDLYRRNAPGSGDVKRAIDAYHKALKLQPNDASVYNRLNLSHWAIGNTAEAIAATEQSVRLSPTTPVYVYNLGFQQAETGHIPEARKAYARLQPLDAAMAQQLLAKIQQLTGESSLIGRPKHYTNPKIELVWIKPGTLMKGAFSEAGIPGTAVEFAKGFYIGKYPVTQAQWQAVMGDNPSFFKNCGGNCPVEQVSWFDAQAFVLRLNQLNDGYRYRLPSEVEWEHAYRAGTTTGRYAAGDIGWHSGNSGARTHPVGEKPPNGFGVYDMGGLVEEWCSDISAKDRISRVTRGNSFYVMSATGGKNAGSERADEVSRNNGFRVAAEKAK